MSIRNGLVFAMEDDNLVEGGDQSMVPETAAAAEAGASQVAEQSGEVEELQAAVEDAVDGAETLGQVEEVLEKTSESGDGVDETAAQVAEIAVESIKNRLGIIGGKAFPAMESFGSKNTRLSATKLALENVRETITRIWEAIKQAVIRMWEKIKSFFLGIAKNTAALTKHLEGLLDRAKKLPDDAKPEKEKLGSTSLAKAFSVKKKADVKTADILIGNAKLLLIAAADLTKESNNFSNFIQTNSAKLAGGGDYETQRKALNSGVTQALAKLGEVATSKIGGQAGTDKESGISYYGPFVGTRVVAYKVEQKKIAGDNFTNVSVNVETYDKIEATEITSLKRDEIYTILKSGIDLLDELTKFEKNQASMNKISDTLRKSTENVLSEIKKMSEDEKDQTKTRALKTIASDVNDVNGILASLGSSFPATVFATAKAAGDYASASIANMKVSK